MYTWQFLGLISTCQQSSSPGTNSNASDGSITATRSLKGVSTLTSLVWPRPNNVHETWHNLPKTIIPEGWSNDWRTWRLTPLFGPFHDPRKLELELTIAHELSRPVRPIMYSKRSSLCFVFQAGSNGDFYHWDDDTGKLHRIVTEPQTTVEEFLKSFRSCRLNDPRCELILRTMAGQERFNEMRREQHERDAEVQEQKNSRFVSL
jgi:hypothetical protein